MGTKTSANNQWHIVKNDHEISSPALLIYPERVEININRMIRISGDAKMLRPHVKTHKTPEIIRMQMERGINKFKTATISEAEMVARCGAEDILLAVQPVGPNIHRFFQLKKEFPEAKISCVADCVETITMLSDLACQANIETGVWLDINNGMNRTGIVPDDNAFRIYEMISNLPMLRAEGLQVYDGHITDKEFTVRKKICDEAFKPVVELKEKLINHNISQVKVVAGGTPTFPVHALRKGVECSPGTLILWDFGYSSSFTDMDFLHAAVLLTRVISKPDKDLLCLDLGHKAVASEMPQPRVKIIGPEEYTIVNHNEEHLVIKTKDANKYKTGDSLYAIPYHICPTVDRHEYLIVVRDNKAELQWYVEARKRKITF